MVKSLYQQATFLTSAALVKQLPPDEGFEVAFAGRSNAGKSTALNVLTGQRQLARTSKTPGRTQLINLFCLEDTDKRLVDLPGYGYAQVPQSVKLNWQRQLAHYLEVRQCLRGLVLLMDIRHPLKESDTMFIEWSLGRALPIHIVLTKADKLSKSQSQTTLMQVRTHFKGYEDMISVQTFSALKKQGIDALMATLNKWFEL